MLKILFAMSIFTAVMVRAQTEEGAEAPHDHHMTEDAPAAVLTGMPSVLSLTVPMSMDGSGTSWIPAHSAVPMRMFHTGEWMVMTHGNLFLRYTDQGGARGSAAFSAPNWFMASVQRSVAEGQQITFRSMLSLDRITEGGDGYPLLLQSGETWNGKPLVDRQHPHDLVAELAAVYSISFGPSSGAFLYFGYPGEPALGPAAFMHRPSSRFNPDAPIGHHWQDATHITFGVSTLGLILQDIKIEGSVFTGREPDEDRFDFDAPLFDSYSGRISYNPSHQLALQVSYGYLHDPEGHGDDVVRTSASALYSVNTGEGSSVHSSLVWGQNEAHHVLLGSLLFETAYSCRRAALYGRFESVEKPWVDLGLMPGTSAIEQVRQYTAGISYLVTEEDAYTLRIGVQGMVSVVSAALQGYYGTAPVSWQVYLQLL